MGVHRSPIVRRSTDTLVRADDLDRPRPRRRSPIRLAVTTRAVRDARRARAGRRRLGARPAAGPRLQGPRHRGLRHRRRIALPALLARSAASSRSARPSRSTSSAPIDVALPRRESKAGRGHKGFAVEGDPSMSLAEAARRRDFTINAIAWDPLTDEYLDPFDGRARSRRAGCCASSIRATFGDDSLRVLRALQFAARFELTLDDDTRAHLPGHCRSTICRPSASGASSRSCCCRRERPSIGFALARELGVDRRSSCPRWCRSSTARRSRSGIPKATSGSHTLMVIDEARRRNGDLDRPRLATVMLGAVCHDLGKPATTAVIDGRIRSPDHEAAGVAPATRLLDRLNVHTIDGFDVRAQVLGLVAQHLKPSAFHKARDTVSDGAFRRLAQKVDLELLARFGARRLPRPHRHLRLLGDGLVPRARARPRRRARAAGAAPAGPAPARPRCRRRARGWARF